jgi:tetratricopeptide (TPR) repeat protein
MVANRAHPLSLDILILLLSFRLALGFGHGGRTWCGRILGILCGVGIVEFHTMVLAWPLLALLVFWLLRRRDVVSVRLHLLPWIWFVVGTSIYLLAAWDYVGSEGYALRGAPAFWQVLLMIVQEQWAGLTSGLPKVGWLLIVCVTLVPAVAVLLVGYNGLNGDTEWGHVLLHLVLTVVSGVVLLNLRGAPWPMLGAGRILVTPYVLTAAVFGYLVAYWFLLPSRWWPDAVQGLQVWIRNRFGILLALPLLVAVCWAPVRNYPDVDPGISRVAHWWTGQLLECLGSCDWLVSDGRMDYPVMVTAKERGRALQLINFQAGGNELYLRYLERRFDTPRLQNAARIGVFPLLEEWLSSDPSASQRIAVLSLPDLWISAGFPSVPDRLVFKGAPRDSVPDYAASLPVHRDFWAAFPRTLNSVPVLSRSGQVLASNLLLHASMVANNLGVAFEDRGQLPEAFECYRKARSLEGGNISALLNQVSMVQRGFQTPEASRIEQDLKGLLGRLDTSRHMAWALSRTHGYVRDPQAFLQEGRAWVMSGQAGLAMSGFKRATEILPGEGQRVAKSALAGLYLSRERREESEGLYLDLLKSNPKDVSALKGLARLAARKGDYGEARRRLDAAEQAGASRADTALDWAIIHTMAGNPGQARIILLELTDLRPELSEGWGLLVQVLAKQKDEPALVSVVSKLENGKLGHRAVAAYANGYLSLMQSDLVSARRHFEKALSLMPTSAPVLQELLLLDYRERRIEDASRHAISLLRLDANHPMANYVIATIQIQKGEAALAEDSLRRSIRFGKSAVALNDLAWLLRERGQYAEAERMVREALTLNDKIYNAWDTLGAILMDTGNLKEAESALRRSLTLSQSDPVVFLHMAQVQQKLGRPELASELTKMLEKRRNSLGFNDQAKLDDLQSVLKQLKKE